MAPFYTPESRQPYTVLTQVGEGAAEAVELPDDEHVARPERAHATGVSRSVVYAGREVLVDVDGVDARSAAGTATGSRPPSRHGRRRSACVVNGRLRQTGEGAVRPAPPCSTHTSPRTTRSWPPCWRRNEPDTAAYRAHAGLERPGPLARIIRKGSDFGSQDGVIVSRTKDLTLPLSSAGHVGRKIGRMARCERPAGTAPPWAVSRSPVTREGGANVRASLGGRRARRRCAATRGGPGWRSAGGGRCGAPRRRRGPPV